MTDFLTAHNMRRLLEAYRTLAPLTIGGPASTSLETSPAGLLGAAASGRSSVGEPLGPRRNAVLHHQQQQQLLLSMQHPQQQQQQQYLWPNSVSSCGGRIEEGRRRHSSCSSLSPAPHYGRTLSSSPHYGKPHSSSCSPAATATVADSPLFPVFSPKDSESSRSAGMQQSCCNSCGVVGGGKEGGGWWLNKG
jgi:hypothetical protein